MDTEEDFKIKFLFFKEKEGNHWNERKFLTNNNSLEVMLLRDLTKLYKI